MLAEAEGEVHGIGRAPHVEARRVVPEDPLVPVRRRVEHAEVVALADGRARDDGVLGGGSAEGMDRRDPAQAFLHPPGHQATRPPRARRAGPGARAAPGRTRQQGAGRLVPGHQEGEEEHEQLLLAERASPDLAPDQQRDQVLPRAIALGPDVLDDESGELHRAPPWSRRAGRSGDSIAASDQPRKSSRSDSSIPSSSAITIKRERGRQLGHEVDLGRGPRRRRAASRRSCGSTRPGRTGRGV